MLPVHLFFHVIVQSVSAKASGCTVRRVTCEHCGTRFIYQLRRKATATAQSYMFIGRGSKKQSAEMAAQGKLQKLLAEGVDPVPCPECGKLQEGMIRIVRQRRLRIISVTSGIFAILLGLIWACTNQWVGGQGLVPGAKIATAVFTAWVACSLMWALLADPNAGAHRRTREALGARCRAIPAEEFDALLREESLQRVEDSRDIG